MKNYDLITGEVAMKRVTLAAERFCMRHHIDLHCLETLEVQAFMDEAARTFVLDFQARVASKKYEVLTVRFPANWWESLKKRWAPKWVLKRWPVTTTEVTVEASAYYPDIEIPDREAYVNIMHRSRERPYETNP